MRTRFRPYLTDLLWLAAAAALGVGALHVNRALESYAGTAGSPLLGPLPDGNAIRVASCGFDRILSDLFWIRTVFYVGDASTAKAGYPGLDRLANLVTDIDPKFNTVYVVMSGAIVGLQGNPDAGIALLEKGVRNTDYWKIHFLLGMNYFLERMDLTSAAREITAAAEKGGPAYLPLLASRLYANGGDRATALAVIQARLREEKDASTRAVLEKRYWDLWITRDLERLDHAIDVFRKREGRAPREVAELVRAGALGDEPRDPRGGSYRIEQGRGATDLEYSPLELHMPYRASAASAEIEERYRALEQRTKGGER